MNKVASQLGDLRAKAEAMPATLEDAMTRFHTALLRYAGALNTATGGMNVLVWRMTRRFAFDRRSHDSRVSRPRACPASPAVSVTSCGSTAHVETEDRLWRDLRAIEAPRELRQATGRDCGKGVVLGVMEHVHGEPRDPA